MYSRPVFATTCLAIVIGLFGCNKTPKLNTVAASGTVTYHGRPVAGASVGFYPIDANSGKPAIGQTDSEGRFTLKTPLGGTTSSPGALLGDYTATVTKAKTVAPTALPGNPSLMSEAERKKMMDEMEQKSRSAYGKEGDSSPTEPDRPAAQSDLPLRYADPKTSLLNYSVKAGDKNEFTLELTD